MRVADSCAHQRRPPMESWLAPDISLHSAHVSNDWSEKAAAPGSRYDVPVSVPGKSVSSDHSDQPSLRKLE